MADVRRSLSALQTLLADNTSGDISAQDARDVLVSEHPENFSQTAAFASEPSSGQLTGDLFFPNNGFYLERYSGSAWVPWGPIWPLTKPVDGDYAWINQGSATVVTTNGGIVLSCPTNSSNFSARLRKKAAPSVPYTVTACFTMLSGVSATAMAGLMFRQSSDGKLQGFCLTVDNGTGGSIYIGSRKYTNATTFSADYSLIQTVSRLSPTGLIWLRIADDNTNRICSYSTDGVNFHAFHTVGRTDFLTADEVGFYVDPYNTTTTMTLLSWKQA